MLYLACKVPLCRLPFHSSISRPYGGLPGHDRLPRDTLAQKALTAVISDAYVKGIFTRSVDELVKAFGLEGISKSPVSRLCEQIDERVQAFLDRPHSLYIWPDATYLKFRRDHNHRPGRGDRRPRDGGTALCARQ